MKKTSWQKEINKVPEHCPSCARGTLIKQLGNYGWFLKCNQFPKCYYKKSLDQKNKKLCTLKHNKDTVERISKIKN